MASWPWNQMVAAASAPAAGIPAAGCPVNPHPGPATPPWWMGPAPPLAAFPPPPAASWGKPKGKGKGKGKPPAKGKGKGGKPKGSSSWDRWETPARGSWESGWAGGGWAHAAHEGASWGAHTAQPEVIPWPREPSPEPPSSSAALHLDE